MSQIVGFLLERIAEEEEVARRHQSAPSVARMYWEDDAAAWPILVVNSDHLLAECEAKRTVALWAHANRLDVDSVTGVLAPLAAAYADHPDYREEWRP